MAPVTPPPGTLQSHLHSLARARRQREAAPGGSHGHSSHVSTPVINDSVSSEFVVRHGIDDSPRRRRINDDDEELDEVDDEDHETIHDEMLAAELEDVDSEFEDEEEEGVLEEGPVDTEPPFDAAALGLKEIGNLASWTVSSHKAGCGVAALRDEDTSLFWQSDGPQPHHLNIHFCRLVSIRAIRIYLDFEADESYTPTRITLLAGTGYHDLIDFASLEFSQPKGWIDVPLDNVGGGEDGKTLRCFLVQVRIVENHQNGKDTHVRGLKIFAHDDAVDRAGVQIFGEDDSKTRANRWNKELHVDLPAGERDWLVEPDWMGEPTLR